MPDQWLIDYSQYSTQSGLPSDHQFVTFTDNPGTCDIVEFEGKNHLRISNSYVSVSLTNMDFSDDVDIIYELVTMRFSYLGIGYSNIEWDEGDWYLSEFDGVPETGRIWKGDWVQLSSTFNDISPLTPRIRHRFRKLGTSIQHKLWLATDPQPAEWNATTSHSTPLTITNSPWWGGGPVEDSGTPAYIAWVGVGLNGFDAPILPESLDELDVDSANHPHSVDAVSLIQANALSVDGIIHAHSIDHITLDAGIQPASDVVATAINHSRIDLSWIKSVGATEYVIQRLKISD